MIDVLQCNHRSWCDFFLDAVLTDGRASVLTRYVLQNLCWNHCKAYQGWGECSGLCRYKVN